MPGVVHTQAGWLDKHEVVELLYDPSRTTLEQLLSQAQGIRKFAKAWFANEDDLAIAKKVIGDKAVASTGKVRRAKQDDQLYYLRHSVMWGLRLEGVQAIRANALLAQKKDATSILSPAQARRLREIQKAEAKKRSDAKKAPAPDSRPGLRKL